MALAQLAVRVAKNGFEKIYVGSSKENKSDVKKAIELADELDFFGLKEETKKLIKEKAEEKRIQKLNKETYDVAESFYKKSASFSASASLMVADKLPAPKKPRKKSFKGKK